ncbi:low-density lipoprotein receptor-related protein 2-like [Saccostrea echinata]|uniref:low-density lipoprotein receptor-related protein 2-like n=1 Tax=Saccostrea echinata TaxID=191078 RepID=UPI002A827FFD|nr:low-density lipoprotein receptor-related protein 2-like [Saccostrea echinata]
MKESRFSHGFIYLVIIFGHTVCKPAFFPDIPYLFWTVKTNMLFYQNNTEQWVFNNTNPYIFSFSYGDTRHKHLGCSYDFERGFLIFSDNSANTITLFGERSNGAAQGTFVHVGTSSGVGHVAVDWVSSNVYWSDSLFGWIGLQALPRNIETISFNSKFRVVVDKFLDVPSGLAVHASRRLLFWTDIGTQPKIERSSTDGSNRKILIWSGIIKPVSVTVDIHNNLLYFTDSARETVESCDLEGNSRRILFYETNSDFYGVEIFKSLVFVSDQSTNRILVLSNTTGHKVARPVTMESTPYSLGLFSEANQPQSSTACDTFGCNQICITELSGAKCLCEDGFSLSADNKTCTETDKLLKRSILVAAGPKICHITITTINSFKFLNSPVNCDIIASTPADVSYFAVSIQANEIFLAKENTIYRQELFETFSSNFSTQNRILGLDYDWVTNTLYWSEDKVSKIYAWNVSSERISNTIEISTPNMGIPKALKVDPFKRRIFYIDVSSQKSIKVLNLEDRSIQVLESIGVVSPDHLIYNRRKDMVFWSDSGKPSLGSLNSNGSNTNFKQLPQGITYSGIAVYKDYLLWLTMNQTKHYLNVQESTILSSTIDIIMPLESLGVTTIGDMRVFDKALQPSVKEPCIVDNDGCQHLCIVEGDISLCACRVGYALQSDGKSCFSAPVENDFLLTTDIQLNTIYQIDHNNQDIHTIDILPGNPDIQDYDGIRGEIVWWDKSKNTIRKSSFDGTNEKAVKGGVMDVRGLNVDDSTGNIFYTSSENIFVTSGSGNVFRKLFSGGNIGSLQVDSKRGIMVWIEGRPNPRIVRSYMDGTNVETVISNSSHSISTPMDLAIDNIDGSVVWCDDTLDKIEIVNMETLTPRIVVNNRGEFPVSVTVLGEFIYYVARDRRSITKISKISGSNPSVVVSSPLFGKLQYLTIYKGSDEILHNLCSSQNGMCSKFCLPRGENNRICACEDGVQIDSNSLCPGDVQCPSTINRGRIPSTCRRFAGDLCGFTCDEGYQTSLPDNTRILCGSTGQWNQTNNLCTVKKCKSSFEHGIITPGCNLEAGSTCGYTCRNGYTKSGSASLICNKNGVWNEDLRQVCKTVEEKNIGAVVGGGAAGTAVVVILIIIIVVVVKRRNNGKDSEKQQFNTGQAYITPSEISAIALSGSQLSTYTTLSEDRESVYDEIPHDHEDHSKNFDQPKSVVIPSVAFSNQENKDLSFVDRGSSIRSERYSRFPRQRDEDEQGYLRADQCVVRYHKQDPEPDYDHDALTTKHWP